MKKLMVLALFALFFSGMTVLQSCNDDDDDDTIQEFIADDSTFSGFSSWSKDATFNGADPSLGMAHGGNDATTTREVFFKDGQDPDGDATYPVGTVIVKHSTNTAGTLDEITAMVKRGNDFNSVNNDWEWFVLNSDGSIATDANGDALRGATLLGGACGNCHAGASAKDYVFSK